jgi:5-methylcytosine-specific restriction enzyme subunit McrC
MTISVHEYGLLAKGGEEASLSCASVPEACWDWLWDSAIKSSESELALLKPIQRNGQLYLKVLNYVGVLETPNGTVIEILPKTSVHVEDPEQERASLMKMLAKVYKLSMREQSGSDLQVFKRPLIEVLISWFLSDVGTLMRRGIKSDYFLVEEEMTFLKGRLRIQDQIKQSVGRRHKFQVSYDDYIPDRPENRLVHLALSKILKWSKSSVNQRKAKEFLFAFADIPFSKQVEQDLTSWCSDRSMAHYRAMKSWCELILRQQSPLSLKGQQSGISMLFPMEQLFEKYVARVLSNQLADGFYLKEQMSSLSLVEHQAKGWFRLKPDLAIINNKYPVCILDTKWKLIDTDKNTTKEKYGLKQSDLYQMFAYGEKYLKGRGEMYLIYPSHIQFNHPLQPFNYSDELTLYVVPFDLANDRLMFEGYEPEWSIEKGSVNNVSSF